MRITPKTEPRHLAPRVNPSLGWAGEVLLSSEGCRGPRQPAVPPSVAGVLAVPPVMPQVMLVVPDEARAGAGEVDEEELPGSPDLLRGCLGMERDYTACRGSGEGAGGIPRTVNCAPNALRCVAIHPHAHPSTPGSP